eukprot:Sspe_Gene.112590::Locus_95653_Transcript_1_1_Confidence_1.000_Length_741::g.112590::m.112590
MARQDNFSYVEFIECCYYLRKRRGLLGEGETPDFTETTLKDLHKNFKKEMKENLQEATSKFRDLLVKRWEAEVLKELPERLGCSKEVVECYFDEVSDWEDDMVDRFFSTGETIYLATSTGRKCADMCYDMDSTPEYAKNALEDYIRSSKYYPY